jgi:hypothetical protein
MISVFVGFSRLFLLRILILKWPTARRLYKSFGVKGLKTLPAKRSPSMRCHPFHAFRTNNLYSYRTLCSQNILAFTNVIIVAYEYKSRNLSSCRFLIPPCQFFHLKSKYSPQNSNLYHYSCTNFVNITAKVRFPFKTPGKIQGTVILGAGIAQSV